MLKEVAITVGSQGKHSQWDDTVKCAWHVVRRCRFLLRKKLLILPPNKSRGKSCGREMTKEKTPIFGAPWLDLYNLSHRFLVCRCASYIYLLTSMHKQISPADIGARTYWQLIHSHNTCWHGQGFICIFSEIYYNKRQNTFTYKNSTKYYLAIWIYSVFAVTNKYFRHKNLFWTMSLIKC